MLSFHVLPSCHASHAQRLVDCFQTIQSAHISRAAKVCECVCVHACTCACAHILCVSVSPFFLILDFSSLSWLALFLMALCSHLINAPLCNQQQNNGVNRCLHGSCQQNSNSARKESAMLVGLRWTTEMEKTKYAKTTETTARQTHTRTDAHSQTRRSANNTPLLPAQATGWLVCTSKQGF